MLVIENIQRRYLLKILPLNELIKFSVLKFMDSFSYNYFPVSFNQMWILNGVHYPERELRNTDHLYVPTYNYATLKRLPRFNFPNILNSAGNEKFNLMQHQFLKAVKTSLSQNKK
jgi:hypothetical protein